MCALAYPIAAHISIERNSVTGVVVALALLAVGVLVPPAARGNLAAWIMAPFVALALWALSRAQTPVMPLYIAPVLVPAFMAWVFGQTLTADRTPLISQFIELLHEDREPPEPAVWVYARKLTCAWTVFFIALAATNFLLAALAEPDGLLLAGGVRPPITVPLSWWSLFANVIGYLLVAAFFVIEYAYRRHRFPQQPFRNVFDFLKRIGTAMPKLLRRDF